MNKRLLSLYVEDAIDAILKIQKFTENISLEEFESNDLISDAVIRNFEVLGEAAKKIPDSIRNQFPEIPWKSIIGLRNSVLHEYLNIDNSILYQITTEELEETKTHLTKCLTYLKSTEKSTPGKFNYLVEKAENKLSTEEIMKLTRGDDD